MAEVGDGKGSGVDAPEGLRRRAEGVDNCAADDGGVSDRDGVAGVALRVQPGRDAVDEVNDGFAAMGG